MDASAWDRPGPVAQPGHVNRLLDTPLGRNVFIDRPVRGERVGTVRMLCGTYLLQALSAVGLIVSLVWISGAV
jgi:hypothetical protein